MKRGILVVDGVAAGISQRLQAQRLIQEIAHLLVVQERAQDVLPNIDAINKFETANIALLESEHSVNVNNYDRLQRKKFFNIRALKKLK